MTSSAMPRPRICHSELRRPAAQAPPRRYSTRRARPSMAAVKHSIGGVTRPAPTWPVPATRPAIPVLICGRMPGPEHPGDIDTRWCAAEFQDRHGERRVLRFGDLIHPAGDGQRVGHRAADEPDDRRRGRHHHAADAHRLGDRRIADVGVGVVGSEAGQEQPVRVQRRPGEPLVAGAGDPDPEVGAVAAHGGHHGAARDPGGRVAHQLAGRHHQVEEEVVVAGDEPGHFGDIGGRQAGCDQAPAGSRAGTSGCRPGCGCGPRRPSAPSGR